MPLMNAAPSGYIVSNVRRKYIFILLGWSVLVGGSLAWNIYQETKETLSMAVASARTNINKDIIFRKWVASHGGVYVQPTDTTPPNPYLKLPDRDVLTTKGKSLTLMNPAYALRELQSSVGKDSAIQSHLTSLNPINPDNVADAWEKDAMQRFEKGAKEVMELQQSDGQSHLRLMTPFIVERDCLKCHQQQGYKLGDIRGGISTYVSMKSYQADEHHRKFTQTLSHGLIWIVGLFGVGAFYRRERYLNFERRLAEAQLRESEALFRNYFELGQVGMCITSLEQKWLRVNRRLCDMLGYTEEELTRMTWGELTHPEDLELDLAQFKRLASGEIEQYSIDERFTHKNGKVIFTHLTVSCQRKPDGTINYVVASLDDISDRKQMEEQVRQLAFYDVLTELPNRRMLNDRLAQALALSKRTGLYGALMFIDLDNFKPLNDTYGHGAGDLLLVEVARRLTTGMREMDTVARFGGDEFVVVLNELEENKAEATSHANTVAEKIQATLGEPYEMTLPDSTGEKIVTHRCSASIGVVMFIDHEATQEELLKWADMAMYQAKDAGRNSIRFYEEQV